MEAILCVQCVNVNILVVIIHYSFAKCFHWENLSEESTLNLSVYIFPYKCM